MTVKRTKSEGFMLRLPDGLRDRIKIVAHHNNRSMNAEIVATLEEKYPQLYIDTLSFVNFLHSVHGALANNDQEYIDQTNIEFSKFRYPFLVQGALDGSVTFVPYDKPSKNDSDGDKE